MCFPLSDGILLPFLYKLCPSIYTFLLSSSVGFLLTARFVGGLLRHGKQRLVRWGRKHWRMLLSRLSREKSGSQVIHMRRVLKKMLYPASGCSVVCASTCRCIEANVIIEREACQCNLGGGRAARTSASILKPRTRISASSGTCELILATYHEQVRL